MNPVVEPDILYEILRQVASQRRQIAYSDLATEYNRRMGTNFGAHGVWDDPLGDLNRRLEAGGHPPLSAVVVFKGRPEPGGGFWGSCSRTSPRPNRPTERLEAYARILGEVHAHRWPATLPRPAQDEDVGPSVTESLAPKVPPLRLDGSGVLRVGGTRVTLDTVVGAYLDGASAEEIVLAYDALDLADVHETIGFYLRHRTTVETYLAQRQRESVVIRHENETRWPPTGIRERLVARRAKAS